MQDAPSRDARSTEDLVADALRDIESTGTTRIIAELHRRGTRAEFESAFRLSGGADAHERKLAARILGQLGHERRSFHDASMKCLVTLLGDANPEVVAAAAVALAHRHDPRAIPNLLQLTAHPDPGVRHGVAVALAGHDRQDAIEALIRLSSDVDKDVRSWATQGIASMTDTDNDGVRSALLARSADEDPETRGEALIGLARRRDEHAFPLVREELRRPFAGDWSVEAAEILGDGRLHDELAALLNTLAPGDRVHFRAAFDRALKACSREELRPSEPGARKGGDQGPEGD